VPTLRLLSPPDPGVLIVAANRVFRSTDRGDSWTAISPDLTSGADRDAQVTMGVTNTDIRIARNDGISNWPTIVSLAESPRQATLPLRRSLERLVSGMPQRCRRILGLRYGLDCTHPEIASRLGIAKASTVRQATLRCLSALTSAFVGADKTMATTS